MPPTGLRRQSARRKVFYKKTIPVLILRQVGVLSEVFERQSDCQTNGICTKPMTIICV